MSPSPRSNLSRLVVAGIWLASLTASARGLPELPAEDLAERDALIAKLARGEDYEASMQRFSELWRKREALRAEGKVGASLQAKLTLTAPAEDHALLASLGEDLKFACITSEVSLRSGEALKVEVTVSDAAKCERCWHYRDDVGHDAAHPTLCGRCTSNLYGAGETRMVA